MKPKDKPLDKLPFKKLPVKRAVWDKELGKWVTSKNKEEQKDGLL